MATFRRRVLLPLIDLALAPLVFPAGWLMKFVRKVGVHKMPLCKGALRRVAPFVTPDREPGSFYIERVS